MLNFIKNLQIFKYRVSFGSVNSSVNIPIFTSHKVRESKNHDTIEGLVRLSIGIEDVYDLLDDLTGSFKK